MTLLPGMARCVLVIGPSEALPGGYEHLGLVPLGAGFAGAGPCCFQLQVLYPPSAKSRPA
jgi:hypothetical protein